MFGSDTLTALRTDGLVSGQPCDVGAYGRNVFNELLDGVGIPELAATAVWAGTELDFKVLIDLIGFLSASARMSAFAPRPLGRHGAFLRLDSERSRLAVRGALSRLREPLPTGRCALFGLPVVDAAKRFGPAEPPVRAPSGPSAQPAKARLGVSEQDSRCAIV